MLRATPQPLADRRLSRRIQLGTVAVGGGAPISIQSMTTTRTENVAATLEQVHALATQGADIVRVAVPHESDARALGYVVDQAGVPIVADVHFSYRLALMALEAGVQGLRLNPGNLRNPDQIRLIAREAQARNVPIRVGANAGSLDRNLLARHGGPTPEALTESAMAEVQTLEDAGFENIKVSVKHQNVVSMVRAYRLLSARTEHPLHLGVTEAGPVPAGLVKSAMGIGILLAEGIGDTIRVSLTADPIDEVKAGKHILQALGLRRTGFDLVACPSCGRAEVDVQALTRQVQERMEKMHLPPLQVAVMGCEVNGPGEARDADVGLAAGPARGLLFSRGRQLGWVPAERMVDAMLEEAVNVARSIAAAAEAE